MKKKKRETENQRLRRELKQAQKDNDALIRLINTYDRMERNIGEWLATEKHKETKWHHYPSPTMEFTRQLNNAVDYLSTNQPNLARRLKFIDIGCGIGTKVMLAGNHHLIGHQSFGLEINSTYVRFARRLAGAGRRGIIFQGNCFKFKHYSDYDIIYWYAPFFTGPSGECEQLNRQVDETIIRGAKPGAVLMAAGTCFAKGVKLQRLSEWCRIKVE